MAIVKGKKLMLFMKEDATGQYKAIGLATNHTLSMNASTKELATKTKDTPDGTAWQTIERDMLNWTISAEALVGAVEADANGGYSLDKVMECFLNGTEVYVEFATTTTNGATVQAPHAVNVGYVTGKGFITKCDVNAPLDDNASYSIEITGNGSLTKVSA